MLEFLKQTAYHRIMKEAEIKECQTERASVCEEILRSLPLWFGIESAILNYIKMADTMPMFVAYDTTIKKNKRAIGFVSVKLHTKWAAEIYVMGIHPDYHRRGLGRKLLKACEDYCRKLDLLYLTVKTLAPSRPNKSYEKTRNFYLAMDFIPVEEFKDLWDENNPCLLLIKRLKN